MNKIFALLISYSLAFSSLSFSEQDSEAVEPESTSAAHAREFFKQSNYSSAKLDPSGNRVSFIEHDKNNKKLMLLDLNSNNMQVIYVDTNDRIKEYYWVDEDTLVLVVRYLDYGRSLYKFDLVYADGLLTEVKQKLILHRAYLIDPLPALKDQIAVEYYPEGEQTPDIYKFDLSKKNISSQLGGRHKLNKNAPEANRWIFNNAGQLKIMSGLKDGEKVVWYKEPQKGRWVEIWREKSAISFVPVSFNSKTKELLARSNHNREFIELVSYNVEQKKITGTVFKIENHDIDYVRLNKQRDGLLYAAYTVNGIKQREYLAGLSDFIKEKLNKNLKASGFWVHDKSLDDTVVLAVKRNSQQPGIYYLFESKKSQLSVLTETRPWLSNLKLGRDQVIRSTSSDGLEIESYLTLPAIAAGKKAPLIVMPHGGPINVRASRDFNSQVQYLASLGYAVLRPNFRGSSGFGKSFKEAGKKQWGQLIEDDIDSATTTVIERGLIDKNKICIFGASYGGYSALISGIRRPDLYKCAASYVGVTDINLRLANIFEIGHSATLDWLKEYYGDPDVDQFELLKNSPVYQANKLTIPVFLAHGLKDHRVDIEHFYRMKNELEKAGNPAETLILENEGHGLDYLNSYVTLFSKLDDFFRESLKLPEAEVLKK